MNIKLLIFLNGAILFCLLIFSCNEKQNKKADESNYKLGNVAFGVPQGEKWSISDNTNKRIVFSLQNNSDSMNSVIEVEELNINKNVTIDSAFRHLEDSLINYFLQYKRISPHYNRNEYKGNECLEYDGIYKDTTSVESSKYFLSFRGVFMQNPGNPEKLSYFKLKHSSIQKKIPDDVLTSYQKLIESVKFE